ncbi:MAG: hypothetical protein P8N58_04420 [Emcibacteraceae bacterium]|jgi:hypothetical protein|nr:hypothetical protein [Emcibacteraceae bacterium]
MKLSHKLKDKLMGLSPKNKINAVLEKYEHLIRERAIAQAKAKIASNGKEIIDFTEEQLEIIVVEEEYQIKSKLKNSTFMSVLAFFGLATF